MTGRAKHLDVGDAIEAQVVLRGLAELSADFDSDYAAELAR
jgi:hypothetical protein